MKFGLLAEIFFPRRCVACGRKIRVGALCETCRGGIFTSGAMPRSLFCGECGASVLRSPHRPPPEDTKSPCHPQFPYILGAAGSYENESLKALVHALKFRGLQRAAEPLADILAEYVAGVVAERGIDLAGSQVMPVPLSRRRQRGRGFNQAELIAERFASHFKLPLDTNSLARVRHTKPQTETKDLTERKMNVLGCFAVTQPDAVRGKKILLIDDVTTSGTTFLEASRALRAAGAVAIIALAIARA
jgi:ComF family protein